MSTGKSLLFAVGITVVSDLALTLVHGFPTRENLIYNSAYIFFVALIVMKIWGGDKK